MSQTYKVISNTWTTKMSPKDLLTGTHFNFNSPPLYVLLTCWTIARVGLPQELQRLTEVKDRKTRKSNKE